MLENIREKSQGLVAKVILGFIILTFAVAGIGSYSNSVDTSVAEVNGEKISQADFEKAYQNQRNRMVQQYGDMFETLSNDANYMANFRNGVVDSLIDQRLIDQATGNMAIRVSDQRIKKTIREMTEFQVDGVFDNNRYLALINQAGFYQSSDFRDYLRVEMTRRQLNQALVSTAFDLPYQSEQLNALQSQKRDIRFANISVEQFKNDIEIADSEINDFYLANQARFENQEKVKVDYITLDVNDIASSIEVSDADIETYYQENIINFRQEEQRRLSHILIEIGEDEVVAKSQIDEILAKLNNGEDFATLAKELSADTFSGENGGDIEWFERGLSGQTFDDAVDALVEVNAISDVVRTEAGFHIIKLTELKAEQVKLLADVKDELTATVSMQKAQDKFFELQQEMARLSFEFPDSLEDAAEGIGSEVKTSDWISRFGNAQPFDNAKVIEEAFSDMIVHEQQNSDLIEVNDSLAVVLRINEYQSAKVKPLAEVSDEIKRSLVAQKASEKARLVADELLIAFKAGNDITEQLAANGAVFEVKADIARYGADVDASLVQEAFKLPHPKDDAISATTITLNNGDLALLEVQAVKSGDSAVNPSLAGQIQSKLSQDSYQSFVQSLRKDATITRRTLTASTNQ